MHASADPQAVAVALVRGSFEYQGQKCSAASRAYIPDTLWPEVRDRALALVGEIHQGDPTDLTTFMGAVIDGRAFARLREAFALAKSSTSARILCGGGCDDSVGWFVEPTIIETERPALRHHGARAVRALPDRLPVPRGALRRDARAVRRHLARMR